MRLAAVVYMARTTIFITCDLQPAGVEAEVAVDVEAVGAGHLQLVALPVDHEVVHYGW